MFSNLVYPAQVFIYCTIVQFCIYVFTQMFVLAGFSQEIWDAYKNKRFKSFLAYFILIVFSIIIKVIIFVGIITTLSNSGANDLANVIGIVYPVILAISIFGLGIYQLYKTYIVDDPDKMDLNKYIQTYTFANSDFNIDDTDATSTDKTRVITAFEKWMKKSSFGSMYRYENWTKTAQSTGNAVTDISFVDKFNDWYSVTKDKTDPSNVIFLPETDADLHSDFIKLTDGSYVNLPDSIETSPARNARLYFVKLKEEVDIEDDSYLTPIKARYEREATATTTTPYMNMQGYRNIEGYSGNDGFTLL